MESHREICSIFLIWEAVL